MTSLIDDTKPITNSLVVSAEIRAFAARAKQEIEALQASSPSSFENANWGHSGTAIAGFSTALPYAVVAGTTYNLTTDKLGYVVEYPALNPAFKFNTATQRFYTDSSVTGQATYILRLVIQIDLTPPKKGEVVAFNINKYSSSTLGTPADTHSLIEELIVPIPNKANADITVIAIFFSDSDTNLHGIGIEMTPSEAGTIRKHSIYATRVR